LPEALATRAGLHTCSISPFGERHIAWHFYAGWREIHNSGKRGNDIAIDTNRQVLPWIAQNARKDNWFLHLNYWDPHRPYRTPLEYGNPFAGDPAPDWPDQKTISAQRKSYGPRSAAEPLGWGVKPTAREPAAIRNRRDWKKWIDGYDTGIRYMDDHIAEVMDALRVQGVYDDLLIIFSADHGENQGELNVYGDHHTADVPTSRVPLIVRGPRNAKGACAVKAGRHKGFLYQLDLCPTLLGYTQQESPAGWDGRSFLPALRGRNWNGRDWLVIGQGAWSAQRSVRVDNWLYLRTYDTGLHDWPDQMLFDIKKDPHQTQNLVDRRPEVVQRCQALMQQWIDAVALSEGDPVSDPFVALINEGGPLYTQGQREWYAEFLRGQGKADCAKRMLSRR
jgi:arylsulfatase A-like enzyme